MLYTSHYVSNELYDYNIIMIEWSRSGMIIAVSPVSSAPYSGMVVHVNVMRKDINSHLLNVVKTLDIAFLLTQYHDCQPLVPLSLFCTLCCEPLSYFKIPLNNSYKGDLKRDSMSMLKWQLPWGCLAK